MSRSIFGEGTILSVEHEKNAYLVQFDAVDTPRKISFKAKLVRKND